MMNLSFDEFLDLACKRLGLSDMARILLPSTLSDETKKTAIRLSPEEFGIILKSAINKIDHGSVETVDRLVRRKMAV